MQKCLVIVWECNDKPNWLSLGSEGSDDYFILLCIFRYRTFKKMITMFHCLKAIHLFPKKMQGVQTEPGDLLSSLCFPEGMSRPKSLTINHMLPFLGQLLLAFSSAEISQTEVKFQRSPKSVLSHVDSLLQH